MIRDMIVKVQNHFVKEKCYSRQEYAGIAVFGMCSGEIGGPYQDEWTAFACVDCKHYVPLEKTNIKEKNHGSQDL